MTNLQNEIFTHAPKIQRNFILILKCSWGNFVLGAKVLSQYLKWFWNYNKSCFCFTKITDTRNLVPLKPVKFRNLGDFTELAIKKFPQSIFWWGLHRIFPIDLGFQPHQIQLYTNLFQVSQKFGSNHLGYLFLV